VLQITPTQQDTPRWMGAFMSLHTWPYLMHVALLVALYVGTAKLGLALHAVGGFATAVWPSTGLALMALVLWGYRLWPGVALGAYLVNVWAGAPLLVAAGMALGNTFEALLGAAFLRDVV
jgi:integral membrane sensor domain MASE1